jgi:RND family efflux transporter MFP subunit
MKKLGAVFFAVLVIAFIVSAMLYQTGVLFGGSKVPSGEIPDSAAEIPATAWKTLELSTVPINYSAVGTIRSREEIEIISRLPSARVIQVNVNNGDACQENSVLIKLEEKDLQAALGAAAANLAAAESHLKFAQEEYDRYAQLVEKQVVARRTFEESVSNLNTAKAQVAMLKHTLENARINLEYASIRAPFDGIVAERYCDPGDLATPQNPLLKIFNPARLQLRIPIRENLFRDIKIGAQLQVPVESTGKLYQAQIKEIIPAVDPGSRSFLINACLEGDTTGLMPGMFAACVIPVGQKEVLAIPASAVLKIGQLEYLHIRSAAGKVARIMVKTVPLAGTAGMLEVVSGAKPGMQYLEVAP